MQGVRKINGRIPDIQVIPRYDFKEMFFRTYRKVVDEVYGYNMLFNNKEIAKAGKSKYIVKFILFN